MHTAKLHNACCQMPAYRIRIACCAGLNEPGRWAHLITTDFTDLQPQNTATQLLDGATSGSIECCGRVRRLFDELCKLGISASGPRRPRGGLITRRLLRNIYRLLQRSSTLLGCAALRGVERSSTAFAGGSSGICRCLSACFIAAERWRRLCRIAYGSATLPRLYGPASRPSRSSPVGGAEL